MLLGIYVCVVGAVVHRHVWVAGGVDWPWGLLAAVAATFAIARAAGIVVRVGGAWFACGWALGLMLLQVAGGDSYLVATDWLGWLFSAGCLGVIVLAVLRPPRVEA